MSNSRNKNMSKLKAEKHIVNIFNVNENKAYNKRDIKQKLIDEYKLKLSDSTINNMLFNFYKKGILVRSREGSFYKYYINDKNRMLDIYDSINLIKKEFIILKKKVDSINLIKKEFNILKKKV